MLTNTGRLAALRTWISAARDTLARKGVPMHIHPDAVEFAVNHAEDALEESARLDWIEANGLPDPKVYDGHTLREAIDAARTASPDTAPLDNSNSDTTLASGGRPA